MKSILIPPLFLSALVVCCNTEKDVATANSIEYKYYEDEVISCTLKIVNAENNIIDSQLEIRNKSNSKIIFELNGFTFKCGLEEAQIPKPRKTVYWKIPNYENLTESEKIEARKNKRKESQSSVLNHVIWHSELSLESNNSIVRKVKLEFKDEVDPQDLIFYFGGVYKKFIKT